VPTLNITSPDRSDGKFALSSLKKLAQLWLPFRCTKVSPDLSREQSSPEGGRWLGQAVAIGSHTDYMTPSGTA
jgi:hypothetical protein